MPSLTIYALCDAAGAIRYIGQTRGELWRRLAGHIVQASASSPRPVLRWLAETYSSGGTVTIIPLKLNARAGDERHAVEEAIAGGAALLNVDLTEARREIARRIAADPAVRAARSKASTAAMTPERRAAVSATFKGKPKSAEWKARMSATMKRRANERRQAMGGNF